MPRKKQAKERKIALCYVRLSYSRDEDDANSPERQKANIRSMCASIRWRG